MPGSKAVVDNHIEEIKLNACLTSDAWSNIKSESIVNYMLISDSSTFFLESVLTSEQNHDVKWIAQDMGRMIDSLAGTSFKKQANRKRVSRRSMTLLRTVSFVELLDKAIMILNPVDTAIVVFQK
ncbi:hypothetical protein BASA60_009329 [Batrachochytrium salamandrivorans]|nr:hypothetical protein BASA60_009329 [Batrachochytrium salamandrivorans]